MNILSTTRILIREWQDSDSLAFITMNADARVMEHFPALLSPEETVAMISRIKAHITRYGYGLWAAELRETGEFMGFIGLNVPTFQSHFTPCVEIGWRLACAFWGRGLATEGAKAILDYGFEQFNLPEIVSFTSVTNLRSQRVMQKIGLHRCETDDFKHPALDAHHRLSEHVLYRLSQHQWQTFKS
ncbi:N-acetyltransferase [Legionella jordanis]|uniref:GNAT family N-acetyltransferase n=1 Tax=Legionella jordanis TaxID=456 RepID=UPI000EFF5B20|nr:GNAT family N-acetyltransferase [Legionella jordanis]RMX21014.1 N-acetyltransferase [Legionella jordanis]